MTFGNVGFLIIEVKSNGNRPSIYQIVRFYYFDSNLLKQRSAEVLLVNKPNETVGWFDDSGPFNCLLHELQIIMNKRKNRKLINKFGQLNSWSYLLSMFFWAGILFGNERQLFCGCLGAVLLINKLTYMLQHHYFIE